MSGFCKRGIELLKEIVNHDPDTLSSYNEELVRLVFSETDEHFKHAQTIIRASTAREPREGSEEQQDEEAGPSGDFRNPADAVALVVHYESMSRNKKLLLSYMLQRVDRLKHVRWQHRGLPTHVSEACSPQEVEFYRSYDKLLTKYLSKQEGIGHDLTLDAHPPRDNQVQVRVVRDAGAHLFSFGRMALREGALLKLPADEAEPLITAGVLLPHDRSEFA